MRCLEIRFDDQLFPWPDLPLFGTDAQHHWVTTHGPVRAIAYSNPAVDEFFNCEERSDENAWECKDTDYRKTVAFVRKIRDGFSIQRVEPDAACGNVGHRPCSSAGSAMGVRSYVVCEGAR